MADCFVAPQVFAAEVFKVPLEPWRNVLEVNEALKSHEAIVKAHPTAQPDYPPKK
jgi:maleylacetoacetate isomerase